MLHRQSESQLGGRTPMGKYGNWVGVWGRSPWVCNVFGSYGKGVLGVAWEKGLGLRGMTSLCKCLLILLQWKIRNSPILQYE